MKYKELRILFILKVIINKIKNVSSNHKMNLSVMN